MRPGPGNAVAQGMILINARSIQHEYARGVDDVGETEPDQR